MERQNSIQTPNSKQTAANSPSSPATNGSSAAASPTRRRKKKTNSVLFTVLRCFAILGPLGFTANIVYFIRNSNNPNKPNGKDPFDEVHSGFGVRAKRHQRSVTHDDPKRALGNRQEDEDTQQQQQQEKEQPVTEGVAEAKTSTTTPPFMSGMQVLNRMQSHTSSSWEECGSSPKSTLALTQQLANEPPLGNLRASNSKESLLQPFGLRLSLQEHLEELQHHNHTQQECIIPQRGTLNCDADTYSIVVTFQGKKNFRPLFMNLLAWLTYPYISDIVVLMPHADWVDNDHTIMDAKYKERIKTWHATPSHKVSMIGLPQQIEEDPTSKYSFDSLLHKTMAKVQSDAVLFMDGTIVWDGNNRGITAGFELWKQNPHGMIATHKLHTGAPQSMCQTSAQKLWTPFCDNKSHQLPTDLATLHQQYQNILDLNGVFVHRSMLCLLGQDPLANILRNNVWKSLDDKTDPQQTLAYARAILAIALLQIAGGPPLLFPPTIARPFNETKDYNNNWHYLPHVNELHHLEQVTANNTRVQQRTLLSLLGYFGNALVANANEGDTTPYWCTAKKQVEGVFFITDISWMEESGSKCKRVAANADILKPVM